MKINAKGSVFTNVKRNGDELVTVTCVLNEELDISAELVLDIHSFEIQDMSWHVYKCEIDPALDGYVLPVGKGRTNWLLGREAYLLAHRAFDELLELPGGKLLKYVFFQCSKAVVQAETFIYDVRGYSDKETYNRYWDDVEAEGCMFYTHPVSGDLRWSDYVGNYDRGDYLFERFKNFTEVCCDGKSINFGVFSDSYHQVEITITSDYETGEIENFDIRYVRVPGKACLANMSNAVRMTGENIWRINKKTVVEKLGCSSGCYHVVDLTWDMILKMQMEHQVKDEENFIW